MTKFFRTSHRFSAITLLTLFAFAGMATYCGKKTDTSGKVSESEMQKIFHSGEEEVLKPTMWDTGDTTISNEDRLDLFFDKVKDRKGGYVGVGSVQNFVLASWADSEWVWLMDFTRIVVAVNRIHIAIFKEAPTPDEYRTYWKKGNEKKIDDLIRRDFASDPKLAFILDSRKKSAPYIRSHFEVLDAVTKKRNYKIWLNDQTYYDRLRNLALKDRILPVHGDLNGPITVKRIGATATQMGIPMRILYFSNAEEYFPVFTEQNRASWTSLPVDEKSLVVRTVSVKKHLYPWAPESHFSTNRGFHYSTMPASLYQEWLRTAPKEKRLHHLMESATVNMEQGTSEILTLK